MYLTPKPFINVKCRMNKLAHFKNPHTYVLLPLMLDLCASVSADIGSV